jgi:hypothetical protein
MSNVYKFDKNDLRGHYNQLNLKIKSNGQQALENNEDERINRIFSLIVENSLTLEYINFNSVSNLDLATKTDDEELWDSTQPRNSINNDERMQDPKVINNAHLIVKNLKFQQWKDYDNPPIYFKKYGKIWPICGNGRIASLRKAEELNNSTIPFSMVQIDVGSLNDLELQSFCNACSGISNSNNGKEVEPETPDEISSALIRFWKHVKLFVDDDTTMPNSFYKWAVDLLDDGVEDEKSLTNIRNDIANKFLEKEKNIQSHYVRGKIISQSFADYKRGSGDRFEFKGDVLNHINTLLKKLFKPQKLKIPEYKVGRQESTSGSQKIIYYISEGDVDPRNIMQSVKEASEDGLGHLVYIILVPTKSSGRKRKTCKTRQSNIVSLLRKCHEWHNKPLNINGNGSTIMGVVALRAIDDSATDGNGNHDCDVGYQWNNEGYTRMDENLFGLNEKLTEELDFSEKSEEE